MTRQITLRSPAVDRRQPLLGDNKRSAAASDRRGVGEVAGGTAAGCAAVCCCCPFAIVDFVVMTVYKIPKGLCRKAWKKKKKMKTKKEKDALLQPKDGPTFDVSEMDGFGSEGGGGVHGGGPTAAGDFEREMWDRFHGAGFWRSPSQRG